MLLFAFLVYPSLFCLFIYLSCLFLATHLPATDFLLFNPVIDASIILSLTLTALILGLFGNYYYYLHASIKIWKAQNRHASVLEQRKQLANSGMVSKKLPAMALIVVIIVAAPVYLYLGNYVDTANRQVANALEILNKTSQSVSSHVLVHGTWPGKLETLNNAKPAPGSLIEEVSLNQQLIVVTFRSESPVLKGLRGKSLAYFGRQNRQNGRVYWTCGSIDVTLLHLPASCRRYPGK